MGVCAGECPSSFRYRRVAHIADAPTHARRQGIEIVRRDNCLLVRNVVTTCLEMILIRRDEEGAKAFVRRTIADLLMNRLDLSLLVVTKASAATSPEFKQWTVVMPLARVPSGYVTLACCHHLYIQVTLHRQP